MSFILGKGMDRIVGFRVSKEDETAGIDFALHAETAYAEGVHGHSPRRLGEGGHFGHSVGGTDGDQ